MHWYDGYSFHQVKSVYSPNSVIEAVNNRRFSTYWTQTETYESLKSYISMNYDGLKNAIISMLGGMNCKIDIGTFQNDMTSFESRDDVLTLLVHLGYLAYDEKTESVYIPNEEVREEFVRAVRNGNSPELIKMMQDSNELLEATLAMDEERVAQLIEKVTCRIEKYQK